MQVRLALQVPLALALAQNFAQIEADVPLSVRGLKGGKSAKPLRAPQGAWQSVSELREPCPLANFRSLKEENFASELREPCPLANSRSLKEENFASEPREPRPLASSRSLKAGNFAQIEADVRWQKS